MKKTVKAAKKAVTAAQKKLIGNAYALGFTAAASFEDAVAILRKFRPDDEEALRLFGISFKAGYVVKYCLANVPNIRRRWGNMGDAELREAGEAIYAKPYPESTKPNRRTDVEHKACRAADVSWSSAKRRAGLTQPSKRKPRPAANKAANDAPRSFVFVSPKFKTKAAANEHYGMAAAALLQGCNVNSALKLSPQLTSAVETFHAALKALGIIPAPDAK